MLWCRVSSTVGTQIYTNKQVRGEESFTITIVVVFAFLPWASDGSSLLFHEYCKNIRGLYVTIAELFLKGKLRARAIHGVISVRGTFVGL